MHKKVIPIPPESLLAKYGRIVDCFGKNPYHDS
jgi:hypothetical protein